jgi:isoleucyl-tRNA synthetase
MGNDYYKWQSENRSSLNHKVFTLADGPPFANGDLHIGHALNKILKDIALRTKAIQGFRVTLRPGWDCHGLPIEIKATGSSQSPVDPVHVRRKCRVFAEEAVKAQKSTMRGWGLMADYDAPYLTMDRSFEAEQLRCFSQMVQLGLVFRDLRPVYWSPSSKTALAEAELEYVDMESAAAYVSFQLVNNFVEYRLLIWTTTPWTIPANQAIAVNTKMEYVAIETSNGSKYIVAKDCLQNIDFLEFKVLDVIDPFSLIGKMYINPLSPTNSARNKILEAPFVRSDTGTGLVHLAPSHGHEDHSICTLNGIKPVSIIDDDGRYTCDGPLLGLSLFDQKATDLIMAGLKDSLVHTHKLAHRCPVDWRTKQPVITRATHQWFIDVSKIADSLHTVVDREMSFYPPIGRDKLHRMIDSRTSWCISRQRSWGVPIPYFIHKNDASKVLIDSQTIEHVAELVQKFGSDCWWQLPVSELANLDNADITEYRKGVDTLDVWFDSGTAWTTLDQKPADLVIEGSDQFRGWFQSSLITSVACTSRPAHKQTLTHGFVLDEWGRKMSKSLGNVVDPNAVVKLYGLDSLRLWIASTDYTEDVSFSEKAMKNCHESYLKLRNTFKFIIANINGYEGRGRGECQFTELDALAVYNMNATLHKLLVHYNEHAFSRVYQQFLSFVSNDLSGFYLDAVKDRLYLAPTRSLARVSAQSALHQIATKMAMIMSPLCPSLVAEVAEHLGIDPFKLQTPTDTETFGDKVERFRTLESVRRLARQESSVPINQSIVVLPQKYKAIFSMDTLREAVGCAFIEFGNCDVISAQKSPLKRCPRCWYSKTESDVEPCDSCQGQLASI